VDNLTFAITIVFLTIFGTAFVTLGVTIWDIIARYRENKRVDKGFELYNDFMPSHCNDDWNGGDDL
jgi:hypothetical protein